MSILEEYRERIIQRERADMLATIAALEAELQTAEEENERLKCCGNCDWYSSSLYDCNDDVDDELDECDSGDGCHFMPSRWEPVEVPRGPEMVPARGPLFGDGVWERRQDNPPGLGLINDVIPPDRVSDE